LLLCKCGYSTAAWHQIPLKTPHFLRAQLDQTAITQHCFDAFRLAVSRFDGFDGNVTIVGSSSVRCQPLS
jgi:hypothetical protein